MADASSVDFRALQLFIAVYDNQSFSVVARREGVSPSLISRTIQQLEDALGQRCSTATPVPWYRPKQDAFSQRPPGNCWDSTPTRNGRYRIGHRSPADWCGSMRRSILVSGISPRLPELAARHPKLQFDLTLTDDFIDPHRDATDILFASAACRTRAITPECLAASAIT